jgi:hypothetical protein
MRMDASVGNAVKAKEENDIPMRTSGIVACRSRLIKNLGNFLASYRAINSAARYYSHRCCFSHSFGHMTKELAFLDRLRDTDLQDTEVISSERADE